MFPVPEFPLPDVSVRWWAVTAAPGMLFLVLVDAGIPRRHGLPARGGGSVRAASVTVMKILRTPVYTDRVRLG